MSLYDKDHMDSTFKETIGDWSVSFREVYADRAKHTAWLVIQRMNRSTGGQFLAPSMFETEALAQAYASMFSDVVSVQKVEWEE